MRSASHLQEQLAAVRLVILDVDGVLTDGGCFIGGAEEIKKFNARDGSGIKYLIRSGIEVALLSGRETGATTRLAQELGIAEVHQKALRKWPVVEGLLERRGLQPDHVAYVGDDLVDLPVMARVGVSIAVADAVAEVIQRADAVTTLPGGAGAVREVAEWILKAQGKWEAVLARYVEAPTAKEGKPS
jgi:3-deoxy-D-manno-octulosonate 8-phosphate phosphatase (KDO 8-P phosphatase)